ncbi:MAG: hypothetical protein ACTSVI_02870 [Promethearchaeota archaeon]
MENITFHESYRCLFDPLYVPKILFGRKKEKRLLLGLLRDNILVKERYSRQDRLGEIILVRGIRGVGKGALNLSVFNALEKEFSGHGINNMKISCFAKDEMQLLDEIALNLGLDVKQETSSMRASVVRRWNDILVFLRKKKNGQYNNLLLQDIDTLDVKFFNKLVLNLKNLGFNIILTSRINSGYQAISISDFNLELDLYSTSELNSIVKDRFKTAFLEENDDITSIITDSVLEYDTARPGPCISVLRNIYPVARIEGVDNISYEFIQNGLKNQLTNMSYSEFEIFDFFSSTSINMLLFLDNITTLYLQQDKYYFTRDELLDLYKMSCEIIESRWTFKEFNNFLAKLMQYRLILSSSIHENTYFSIVPASLLRMYLDESLK